MKYYEVLVVAKTDASYYEGNFYIKAQNVVVAVSKVKEFLEIDDSYKIYTRELSRSSYLAKLEIADRRNRIKNDLLTNDFDMNFGSISFDKITSTAGSLDFVDLSRL